MINKFIELRKLWDKGSRIFLMIGKSNLKTLIGLIKFQLKERFQPKISPDKLIIPIFIERVWIGSIM